MSLEGHTDEDLFEGPHLAAAKAEDMALLKASRAGKSVSGLTMEMWKKLGEGKLPRVQWVRVTKQTFSDRGRKYILGITEEISVAEREAELQKLSGVMDDNGDTDFGFYVVWLGNGRKLPSETQFSPEFLRRFPEASASGRFGRVVPSDRWQVTGFVRTALKARRMKNTSVDFRYQVSTRKVVWLRGEAYRLQIHGRSAVIVTHRRIRPPNVGEMLNRTLLDHIPHFVFVKDSKRQMRFMNDALLQAIGKKSLADVLNQTDDQIQLGSEEQRKAFAIDDQRLLDAADESPDERPVHSAIETLDDSDGRIRLLLTIKTVIPSDIFAAGETKEKRALATNPDGALPAPGVNRRREATATSGRHILGISIDVTEIWNQHESITALQKTVDGLSDGSDAAIYLKDMNDHYVQVNESFRGLCGKSDEEILGKTTAQVWKKQGSALVSAMRDQDEKIKAGAPPQPDHRLVTLPDGKKQLRSTLKLLLNDGKKQPFRILGISTDLTNVQLFKYIAPNVVDLIEKRDYAMKEKEVTVLFCDIRDFSGLAAKFSDSIVVLLQKLFEKVARLCLDHHCIFDKFLGDGAMVFAGVLDSAQRLEKPAPVRVAQLALDLRDGFDGLIREWLETTHASERPKVRIGIGIHVEKCHVGILEAPFRIEFSAYGPAVTTARRIQQVAAKRTTTSQILVSPRARALLGEAFEFGREIEEKEKKDIFAAFELVGQSKSAKSRGAKKA